MLQSPINSSSVRAQSYQKTKKSCNLREVWDQPESINFRMKKNHKEILFFPLGERFNFTLYSETTNFDVLDFSLPSEARESLPFSLSFNFFLYRDHGENGVTSRVHLSPLFPPYQ